MKRFASLICAALAILVVTQGAQAGWGSCTYGGYQPWWNIFAPRNHCSKEEQRLQRFWHDYYDALRRYYGALDHIDWVAYYKNHGYQINGGCGSNCRIQFAPVFVSPTMQWAVPNGCMSGPAMGGPAMSGPAMGGPAIGGPAIGGPAMAPAGAPMPAGFYGTGGY